MAVSYDIVKPVAGGGFGDCKIGIISISGTYATNGFDAGIKDEPLFIYTNNDYVAKYASGKIKLYQVTYTAGDTPSVAYAEVANNADIASGTKIMFIFKGAY